VTPIAEVNVPDPEYFMELGYDRVPGEGTKHYRYLLKTPLEESIFMEKTPFQVYHIIRG